MPKNTTSPLFGNADELPALPHAADAATASETTTPTRRPTRTDIRLVAFITPPRPLKGLNVVVTGRARHARRENLRRDTHHCQLISVNRHSSTTITRPPNGDLSY